MKVRNLKLLVLVFVVAGLANQNVRAENHRPSQSTLHEMGLGGLVVLSDQDAMRIRGQGFKGGSSVAVFGNSSATFNAPFGSAHSQNGYLARGSKFAAGKNGSHAGVEIKTKHGGGNNHVNGLAGNSGRDWRGKPGMGGGHHGGKGFSLTIKFFAGGYSSAFAH